MKMNPARMAARIYLVAAMGEAAKRSAEDMDRAEDAKKLRCIASYASSVMKSLFDQLPPEKRAGVAKQAKHMRMEVVPRTQKKTDGENLRVLSVDDMDELVAFDPLSCVACELEGKELKNCPLRKLYAKYDCDIMCDRE